jgi:hypothetical protein|tara:strand:- start:729 stop:1166 length:438 start_codon:yes stop_codon:yes gene_type:complete
MKNFNEFVNEKFKYESSFINGKKISSSFQGSTSSMNDFIKQIKSLPATLESIKIPIETSAFNPENKTFKGPISSGDKNQIIKIIKDITKDFKKEGDPITKYGIRSFYGVLSGAKEVTDACYIRFSTEGHSKFGKAMSRGDYGPLD